MTGEVPDRFDERNLFYLDKKQFIELQNLQFIFLQSRTPLLLSIYLFHRSDFRLDGMYTIIESRKSMWSVAKDY